MAPPPIKVLLVEDSPIALEILQRLLNSSTAIKVVGTAHHGKQALELIPGTQPDVVCVDLLMEYMDGLELTRQVMASCPRPILVISNAVQETDTDNIFRLLQAGAVDVFPKPKAGSPSDYEKVKTALIHKIKVLSGVKVFTRPLSKPESCRRGEMVAISPPKIPAISNLTVVQNSQFKVLAIGASTGGPGAFEKILCRFPAHFPLPVICAQHISEGFLEGLTHWLKAHCSLNVKIAQIGELPQPGTIYFAPETQHLELNAQGRFSYSPQKQARAYCPSITLLFKSIARFYGNTCLGVLLTGMGNDGAEGLKAIFETGGLTIAQDESTSVIFGMPKEAIALGAAQYVLPLQDIAPFLLTQVSMQSAK
jgi:two-component system, chemotaxis family, protein-glutamate methylesterase/glutaminase